MQSEFIKLLPYELIGMIYDSLQSSKDIIRFSQASTYIYAALPAESKRIINILKSYRSIYFDINNIKYLSNVCNSYNYSIRIKNQLPILCIEERRTRRYRVYYYSKSILMYNYYENDIAEKFHSCVSILNHIRAAVYFYIDPCEITDELASIINIIAEYETNYS